METGGNLQMGEPLLKQSTKVVEEESEYAKSFGEFKKVNKGFWITFNLMTVFFSFGFAAGTYLLMDVKWSDDCNDLKLTSYMLLALHSMNLGIALFNLTGMDKVCFTQFVCCLFCTELTILVFI